MTVASDADDATVELLRQSGAEVRVDGTRRRSSGRSLRGRRPSPLQPPSRQRPIGELRSDPEWRRRLKEAISETCSVAAAEGVEALAGGANGRSSTRCLRS